MAESQVKSTCQHTSPSNSSMHMSTRLIPEILLDILVCSSKSSDIDVFPVPTLKFELYLSSILHMR